MVGVSGFEPLSFRSRNGRAGRAALHSDIFRILGAQPSAWQAGVLPMS